MLKLAVIGKDVSASQSPTMHKFILSELGEECSYDCLSIPPESFADRIGEILDGYDGFNVTIPYKTEIMPYLCEICGDALSFGAVNTVDAKGRRGYNTDGFGFLLMLENEGLEPKGKSVLIIGIGGAGRSAIVKLAEAGANVYAFDRKPQKLYQIAEELKCFTPLETVPEREFDIIVNCTGIGMHDTVGKTPDIRNGEGILSPVGSGLLSRCGAAVDLIYHPQKSEFLRVAEEEGKRIVNGLSMLFYQAYMADCIYLGISPSAEKAKNLFEKYKESL